MREWVPSLGPKTSALRPGGEHISASGATILYRVMADSGKCEHGASAGGLDTHPLARHHVRMKTLLAVLALVPVATSSAQAEAFKIRGIKGLWWEGIGKYEQALPWLAEHNLNFLMLCYSSFPASGADWRADYTPQETAQIRDLTARGKKLGVDVCLSFNPGIWSKPPLVYSSEQDYQRAWDKVRKVHALGVRWFALCLDDIGRELTPEDKAEFGTLQAAQTSFVNRLWRDMKTLRPRTRLIFCPSAYLTADARRHMDYITHIGEKIDREVMMFWTGPECCSASITADDAAVFAKWIRRKPFVWDNYPVNDMFPWRPLVAPLKRRSADLAGAVSGYIANPMKQWHVSTIPLSTTAAYLNDPAGYDAAKAIEQAIRSYPTDQQRAVRLLVGLYGSSFWGEEGFPPQPRPSDRDSADGMLPKYRALKAMLSGEPALSHLWEDVKPTLEQDIATIERRLRDRRVESPLKASGDDFEGGAGSVFGCIQYGRPVNYVYAKPTGRSTMSVEFYLDTAPPESAVLRLTARDGDTGRKSRIRIAINDSAIFEAVSPFPHEEFEPQLFDVPRSALKDGANVLTITNLEEEGVLGAPPWFMVSEAELAPR